MSIAADLSAVLFGIDIRKDDTGRKLKVTICDAEPSCPVHKMGVHKDFFTLREGVDKIMSIFDPDDDLIFELDSQQGFHMVVLVCVDIIKLVYGVSPYGDVQMEVNEKMKDGVLFVELRMQNVDDPDSSCFMCEIHAPLQMYEISTRTPLWDNLLHEASYNKELGAMLKRLRVSSSTSGNSDVAPRHAESLHDSYGSHAESLHDSYGSHASSLVSRRFGDYHTDPRGIHDYQPGPPDIHATWV
jgi:hypothetical protein